MKQVKGKFEVKGTPLDKDSVSQELGLLQMKFEKTFFGPLSGTGLVSMMGIMNQTIGSGGYVAIERVVGELDSLKGSFYLEHSSSLSKGVASQAITVIPDSGKGDLEGIAGNMMIDIINGEHFYTFNYSI